MAKDTSVLREIRTRLCLSQADCAAALGVAIETLRTWDAGRRPAPEAIVSQARKVKAKPPLRDRVPLQVLADELKVHVRTLRAAAHDGRLAATFGLRPFFGKLTATATREAGAEFMATWYRRTYGRGRRRPWQRIERLQRQNETYRLRVVATNPMPRRSACLWKLGPGLRRHRTSSALRRPTVTGLRPRLRSTPAMTFATSCAFTEGCRADYGLGFQFRMTLSGSVVSFRLLIRNLVPSFDTA
jgi:transcriptional regulator with XRE-family HTH domain